jgi:hypothetical protein
MNALKHIFNHSRKLISCNPWMFLCLIPIFYLILPNVSHRHDPMLRTVNKLLPTEVQSEFRRSGTEIDKLFRSSMLALIAFGGFRVLEEAGTPSLDN